MIEPLSERDGDPLAKLVAHARELDVEYDVDAGLARHRIAVADMPPPGWLSQLWTPTKIVIAALVVTVGAAAAWRGWTDEDADPPMVRAALIDLRAPDAPPPKPALVLPPPLPRATPSEPAQDDVPERATAARVKHPRATKSAPKPAAKDDDDALAREAAQIRRARALLEHSDAAAALALCDAMAREFPRGTFVPERSGIRVLALHALGRPHAAAARAWLDRWPNGPLANRIRQTLDE